MNNQPVFFRIKKIFAPPVFEGDDDRTRVAKLVNTFAYVIWIIVIVSSIVQPILSPSTVSRLYIILPLTLVEVVVLVLNRSGQVRWASIVLVALVWIGLTYLAILGGGVRTPAFSSYVLLVLLTGLLLGMRESIVVASMSVVAGLGMVYAVEMGIAPKEPPGSTEMTMWFSQGLALVAGVVLLHMSISTVNEMLARARKEIDERKRAEQVVRESEHKFRSFVEESAEGFMLVDEQGTIIEWNRANQKLMNLEPKQFIGKPVWEILHHSTVPERQTPKNLERLKMLVQEALRSGTSPIFNRIVDAEIVRADGQRIFIEETIFPIKTETGYRIGSITRDVTERRRVEEQLQIKNWSIQSALSGIVLADLDGALVSANPAFVKMLGYESENDVLKLPLMALSLDIAQNQTAMSDLLASGQWRGIASLRRKDGSTFDAELSASVVLNDNGKPVCLMASIVDVTANKKAEESLSKRDAYLQAIMNNVPYLMWLKDPDGKFLMVNDMFAKSCGRTNVDQVIGTTDLDIWPRPLAEKYRADDAQVMATCQQKQMEEPIADQNTIKWFETFKTPILDHEGHLIGTTGIAQDITERKRAEEQLRESENRFRTFVEHTSEWIFITDEEGTVIEWNPGAEQITGLERHQVVGKPVWEVQYQLVSAEHKTGEMRERMKAMFLQALQTGQAPILDRMSEAHFKRADGVVRVAEQRLFAIQTAQGFRLSGVSHDITERKSAEEQVTNYSNQLEALHQISLQLTAELNVESLLQSIARQAITLIQASTCSCYLLREDRQELERVILAGSSLSLSNPTRKRGEGLIGKVWERGMPIVVNDYAKWEEARTIYAAVESRAVMGVPIRSEEKFLGVLTLTAELPHSFSERDVQMVGLFANQVAIAIQNAHLFEQAQQDIKDRQRAEEQTQRQLDRLAALHSIDMAISGSFDLRITLDILIGQVITQLGVDAADVLLFDPTTHVLHYSVGRGFRSAVYPNLQLRLGEDFGGRVVLERSSIFLADVAQEHKREVRLGLDSEQFVSYFGVPLIVKGEVQGVIEIFHRSALTPDQEWITFLETLASHAAIAIENMKLFDGLQRSNIELTLAYDATLESWSRVMDLQDQEPEGHTLLITESAVALARALGMKEAELVNVRRGALLHDVGKMVIPARIFLKPGPLTEEERVLIRKHPEDAHRLLSPIQYLRSAIDIPYCHHERWNGTGYPRGLKGEEIPLAARIFALVDTWDALCSDRPFRPAWSKEKAYDHIRSEAGKHFDPKVVEVFLAMADKNQGGFSR